MPQGAALPRTIEESSGRGPWFQKWWPRKEPRRAASWEGGAWPTTEVALVELQVPGGSGFRGLLIRNAFVSINQNQNNFLVVIVFLAAGRFAPFQFRWRELINFISADLQ